MVLWLQRGAHLFQKCRWSILILIFFFHFFLIHVYEILLLFNARLIDFQVLLHGPCNIDTFKGKVLRYNCAWNVRRTGGCNTNP